MAWGRGKKTVAGCGEGRADAALVANCVLGPRCPSMNSGQQLSALRPERHSGARSASGLSPRWAGHAPGEGLSLQQACLPWPSGSLVSAGHGASLWGLSLTPLHPRIQGDTSGPPAGARGSSRSRGGVSCEVPSVSGHPEIVQDRSQHILRKQPTHRRLGPAPLPRVSVSPVLTEGLDSGVNPFSTEVRGSHESQGWPVGWTAQPGGDQGQSYVGQAHFVGAASANPGQPAPRGARPGYWPSRRWVPGEVLRLWWG